MLLTREQFRNSVFERDNHACVICGQPAQDAHHILERRLFDNGGYYLDNGASLCGECHIKAEKTLLTCEQIREAAKIESIVLPDHLYEQYSYDKWGNIISPDGSRIKGELFNDGSVQKILADVLSQFKKWTKYPRTYHLPFSPGVTKDDRMLPDCSQFEGKEVVVTEKLDGENTTIYQDYLHARATDDDGDPARDWVKNLASKISYSIPNGWRICGENMYEIHSIHYKDLPSYFFVFSIWNDKNVCLSWDDTVEYAKLLDLEIVPVLYRGTWEEKMVADLHSDCKGANESEGFVVRVADSFSYSQFRKNTGKYVRKDHIRTQARTYRRVLNKNGLKTDRMDG